MSIPSRFTLTPADRDSATWRRFAAHLEDQIKVLHGKLEANQTPEETSMLRGQILGYRYILSLAKELPPQT